MPTPITIPRLGWNMEQGTFVEWLKADGDTVRPGDRLYRLEGEKSVEEIESLDGGILHIPVDPPKAGDIVAVGTEIGQLLQPGEVAGVSVESNSPEQTVTTTPVKSSPRARRLAARHGIETAGIKGTGRSGRIRERDVA